MTKHGRPEENRDGTNAMTKAKCELCGDGGDVKPWEDWWKLPVDYGTIHIIEQVDICKPCAYNFATKGKQDGPPNH